MCRQCENFIEKGAKILDLGCGSAIVGKTFQDFFQAELAGVDVKDQRVAKIHFQIFDGKNLPFSDNSFDVILINYVLHHAQKPEVLLREARRVTDDKIIIFEDLPEGFFTELICFLHGLSYKLFFQKDEQEGKFFGNEEWKKVFSELGLRLIFEKKVSHILNPIRKKLFVLQKGA